MIINRLCTGPVRFIPRVSAIVTNRTISATSASLKRQHQQITTGQRQHQQITTAQCTSTNISSRSFTTTQCREESEHNNNNNNNTEEETVSSEYPQALQIWARDTQVRRTENLEINPVANDAGYIGDPVAVKIIRNFGYMKSFKTRMFWDEGNFTNGANLALYYIMGQLQRDNMRGLDAIVTERGKADCRHLVDTFDRSFFIVSQNDCMDVKLCLNSIVLKSVDKEPGMLPARGGFGLFVDVEFHLQTGEHFYPTNQRQLSMGFVRSVTMKEGKGVGPQTWFVHRVSSLIQPSERYHEKVDWDEDDDDDE